MDRKLWEQLPVYRRLENEVKRHIADRRLKRHDRLPSESQLAAEYGVSIGTVRKALNNLVTEKIIYRRHGQGTFGSPRSRKRRIPVVAGRYGADSGLGEDFLNFLFGALDEANSADLPCEPALVELEVFFRYIDYVRMIYPETVGVLFFRGHENLLRAEKALEKQELPFLFYGPNLYGEKSKRYSTVHHHEATGAALPAAGLAPTAACGWATAWAADGGADPRMMIGAPAAPVARAGPDRPAAAGRVLPVGAAASAAVPLAAAWAADAPAAALAGAAASTQAAAPSMAVAVAADGNI